MSVEVRDALENELAALLTEAAILDVPVFPGSTDTDRPDRYVSIVAGYADPRGSASLVPVEFRVVAPVDGGSSSWLAETYRKVSDWVIAVESPLQGYTSETLAIYGSGFPQHLPSQTAWRSRAEILKINVGAEALPG